MGSTIIRTGHFPRGEFVLIGLMIGIAVIIASGLAGWMMIQATRGKFYDQALPVAAQIAGIMLLVYAGIVVLLGIDIFLNIASPEDYFEYTYLLAAWILGFGLPGWKLFRWGRNYIFTGPF